jgi:hypothetical protein
MARPFLSILISALLIFGGSVHAQEFNWRDEVAAKTALSPEEILAFTRSSTFTTLLSTAVDQLNHFPTIQASPRSLLKGSGISLAGFPFANGEFIFSREMMTGNFQAVDNLLHLVDQFGVKINAGLNLSTPNLPTNFRAGGGINVSVSRVFSHFKPILSFKKANRYPFKNAFVSFFLKKRAHELDPVLQEGFPRLPFEIKKDIYQDSVKKLLEGIETGESLLITDSFSIEGNLTAGSALYQVIDLSGNVRKKELTLKRIHIHRLNENTFQIFEDSGNAFQPETNVQIGLRTPVISWEVPYILSGANQIENAVMPIFRTKWGRNKGNAQTQLFQLQLNPNPESEEELARAITDLRDLHQVIADQEIGSMEHHQDSVSIENLFDEKNNQNRISAFSHKKLWSSSKIQIQNKDESKQFFIREQFGSSNGFNFSYSFSHLWSYLKELLTHSASDYVEDNVINPGYSAQGLANNRFLIYEAEVTDQGETKKEYIKLLKIDNGWNLSAEKIQKRVSEIYDEYGDALHKKPVLSAMDRLFLYSIRLEIGLDSIAIAHLAGLSDDEIREIFKRHGVQLERRLVDDRIEHHLKKFRKDLSTRHLLKAISIADRHLDSKGLIDFLGGPSHIRITLQVQGIHQTDENLDPIQFSNRFWIAGESTETGPLSQVQERLQMDDGEFLALWIKGRIF